MTRIHIGFDSSLIEEGVSADNARVYVEVQNCEVSITCDWGDAWAGSVYRECDSQFDAESLARTIAQNPVSVLTRLGYDLTGWFKAA